MESTKPEHYKSRVGREREKPRTKGNKGKVDEQFTNTDFVSKGLPIVGYSYTHHNK